ncbi:2-dehydropantoate 2-reductase [Sulfitobacter albidus]|uniref:2-dehydropantoate 2-reductase n=1 Tax=Sulfitobacter albidus TaxID=2829501 RepID=A0A975PML8_9RHOB|nr:2-dehydropantoate 2-reductase [Sulfitobacter albidus]QUJ76937.1 2-dehydropantoate 2-reductase [Sulfitobacter albidus]
MENKRIAIVGVGAIGGFVAGQLIAAGRDVVLIARGMRAQELAAHGLRLTDYDGLDRAVSSDALRVTDMAGGLAGAGVVLVCVKTADTAPVAAQIAAHALPTATVVSLQNGVQGAERLRAALPGHRVLAGIVPFNVVPKGAGQWHRASSGDSVIGPDGADVAALLSVPGLSVGNDARIEARQWGKLLINLGNAVNALSGMPLLAQLMDHDWRRLMADQMAEALTVLRAQDLPVTSMTPLPAGLVPHVLRLPTPLFRRIAAQMLTIDPDARSSMAQDVAAGRPTEIDALQGEIIARGRAAGVATPLNCAVRAAIKRVEEGGALPKGPAELRR